METVFKVGMEVWDKTISPNKGRVIEVFTDSKSDFPIKVEFENDIRARYTNKGRFVKSEGVLPTLSTTDYSLELKGFEQKTPTPTYEEVVRNKNYIYLPENLVAPNKELAGATIALLKLLFLRDYYNEGWQPDWKDSSIKYCIEIYLGEIDIRESCRLISKSFSFKSKEIAEKFLKEQKELLEIAKPLL
ncbi:hypothetical protein [Capnocytophaga leadbetteri]